VSFDCLRQVELKLLVELAFQVVATKQRAKPVQEIGQHGA
jgi:hypothetical protein